MTVKEETVKATGVKDSAGALDKNSTKALFDRVFAYDRKWNKWFFGHVSRPEHIMELRGDSDRLLASLHLMPYVMKYRGSELPVSYIFGAMTSPEERGRGHMSELMTKALKTSYERGDAFLVLIPADRRLYFFYDKFDFSTVFYIRERRYVDMHIFQEEEGFETVEPDFALFSALEAVYDSMVTHNAAQFEALRQDLDMDSGGLRAVRGPEGERALAAYCLDDGELRLRLLLSETPKAEEAVLAAVKKDHPLCPMVVEAVPQSDGTRLEARGMARLVNPRPVFAALAAYKPSLKYVIRLKDRLLPENSAVYRLSNGHCETLPYDTPLRYDLDTTSATMCSILFSGRKTADILGLPVTRGFMALMLD